jgi:hypothetical protein
MAEQMLQMGLIKNPKEYFQVINTGSIESMFEGDMNEMLLIKKENEFLMSGKEVMADMLDTHAAHIMEHRTVMADPELRMNPELRAVVQKHIQEHIDYLRTTDPDLLMLTGQQPLQSPGVPQGVPPMGGPIPQQGMDQMMAPMSGMPSSPEELIRGQGNAGGGTMPNMPNPPPPFSELPVTADQMLPS